MQERRESTQEEIVAALEFHVQQTEEILASVEIRENHEPLELLEIRDGIRTPKERVGDILIRKSVLEKLYALAEELRQDNLGIFISDGWRSRETQEKYWVSTIESFREKYPDKSEEEVQELATRFAADPDNAPHRTGGAVDVSFYDLKTGQLLDFGSNDPYASEEVHYTDYPLLNATALENRKSLKEHMESSGFQNYPREWWHYSYGNQEWAAYGNKEHAVYDVVDKEEGNAR